jgi:hypothetical protein
MEKSSQRQHRISKTPYRGTVWRAPQLGRPRGRRPLFADRSGEGLVRATADHFKISRQAVHRHVGRLIDRGVLLAQGNTRNRTYVLAFIVLAEMSVPIKEGAAEDIVWSEKIAPHFKDLPENIQSIWRYGFTEMFNNALDHSGGSGVFVGLGQEGHKKCMLIRGTTAKGFSERSAESWLCPMSAPR